MFVNGSITEEALPGCVPAVWENESHRVRNPVRHYPLPLGGTVNARLEFLVAKPESGR